MYGPFNTVRAILVAGAVIAAIVAAALGFWVGTLVLGVAVAAHGLLWVWLYRQAEAEPEPSERPTGRRGAPPEV